MKNQGVLDTLENVIRDLVTFYSSFRVLYQQKVFIYVMNKLLSDMSQITRPEYLRTFGYVVGYAPKEVIMMYFKKVG